MKEIIFFICILLVIGAFYILVRNFFVLELRRKVLGKCWEWLSTHPGEENPIHWCYPKLPSYEEMLFSFKPVKLETWLTQEEIDKLNS